MSSASTDAAREDAALALNLWSSQTGHTGGGLGTDHFTHGTRMRWSVDDLAQHVPATDPARAAAVYDANRAFEGCVDHGVVAPWVQTQICGGAAGHLLGPANAPCVALDDECRRGVYDAGRACCTQYASPVGAACTYSPPTAHDARLSGVCDGRGGCVDPSTVPQSARAQGDSLWVEPIRLDSTPWGVPTAWRVDAGHVVLFVGNAPVASIPGDLAGHRTRLVQSAQGFAGAAAIDVTNDSAAEPRSLYVPRRLSIGVDTAHGATFEVCAAVGPFDALPSIFSDCRGATTVTCPSAPGAAITCALSVDGFSIVTAPALAGAWEASTSAITPPTPAGDASGIDGGASASSIDLGLYAQKEIVFPLGAVHLGIDSLSLMPQDGCPDGAVRSCMNALCPPGVAAFEVCSSGVWGACTGGPDRCDGVDRLCVGYFDPTVAAVQSCDDGTACTQDTCGRDASGAWGCVHDRGPQAAGQQLSLPSGQMGPVCRMDMNLALGSTPRPSCVGPPLCVPPSELGVLTARRHTSFDANGCVTILDDDFCTNEWDGCACNGTEVCIFPGTAVPPGSPPADPVSGCTNGPTLYVLPNGAAFANRPCETNGSTSVCTRQQICCEPDASTCHRRTTDPVIAGQLRVCTAIANSPAHLVVHRRPANGPAGPVECLDTPPLPSGSSGAPGNVCLPDGNPCTLAGPLGPTCTPTLISSGTQTGGTVAAPTWGGPICSPETYAPIGPQPAEQIVAAWQPVPGVTIPAVSLDPCSGNAPLTRGCSTLQCNGVGMCTRAPIGVGRTTDPGVSLGGLHEDGCSAPIAGTCWTEACDITGFCSSAGVRIDPANTCPTFSECEGSEAVPYGCVASTATGHWPRATDDPSLPLGCELMNHCYIFDDVDLGEQCPLSVFMAGGHTQDPHTRNPHNPCETCNPGLSVTSWSPLATAHSTPPPTLLSPFNLCGACSTTNPEHFIVGEPALCPAFCADEPVDTTGCH